MTPVSGKRRENLSLNILTFFAFAMLVGILAWSIYEDHSMIYCMVCK